MPNGDDHGEELLGTYAAKINKAEQDLAELRKVAMDAYESWVKSKDTWKAMHRLKDIANKED